MSDQHLPCGNCPWRKTTKRGDYPGGGVDAPALMAMLTGTSMQVMGCHGREGVCVGFALVVGSRCPGYRLTVAQGFIDEDTLETDNELRGVAELLEEQGVIPHPSER